MRNIESSGLKCPRFLSQSARKVTYNQLIDGFTSHANNQSISDLARRGLFISVHNQSIINPDVIESIISFGNGSGSCIYLNENQGLLLITENSTNSVFRF
jgi:hypothetical protein